VLAARALAKLSKAQMAVWAQFKTGPDEDAVNIDACLALEFEEHVDHAGVVGAAAQHPASATVNGAGKTLHQARRFLNAYRLHLHRPRAAAELNSALVCHLASHSGFIGGGRDGIKSVADSNGA
jgi:hypothetical protein